MSKKENKSASTIAGNIIQFVTILVQIVFLVLKLLGIINWDWVWVLAPSWTISCLSSCLLFILAIAKILIVSDISDDIDD